MSCACIILVVTELTRQQNFPERVVEDCQGEMPTGGCEILDHEQLLRRWRQDTDDDDDPILVRA